MNNIVGVTIGDIKGIGIEILIKEWKKGKIKNFVLVTNLFLFKKYLIKKKINIKIFESILENKKLKISNKFFNIFNIESKNNDDNTLLSIKKTYELTKKKYFIGIITLPLNKYKISKINKKFIDQTSFFTKKDKKIISNMIFIYKNLIFCPLTIHIKLKKVSDTYKNNFLIQNKILSLNKSLKKDFNIKQPKFILAGINPHSGENGLISSEDKDYLFPIIKHLKRQKVNISGPFSPDAILNDKNFKYFDCFLFTYHDQALIPFKLISKYSGVNYTSNLDIIRTSPDHGTAYDMVGKRNLSSDGIINCFKVVKMIASNRNNYEKSKKITRSKLLN